MNEPEEGAQIPTSEFGSDFLPSGSVPLDTDSQDLQQRKIKHLSIPYRCFEIEREVFMCTQQDEDELKTY